MSISKEALGRDMLLTTRVVELSGHRNISAGQTFFPGLMLRFRLVDGKLLAEKVGEPVDCDGSAAYSGAVRANGIPGYAFVFDVESADGDVVAVDVTRFFGEEIQGVCPLPAGFKSGKFEPSLSGIVSCGNLPGRINVAARLIYSGVKDPFSALVSYNLMLMDEPMTPRIEDPRIGYMTTGVSAIPEDGGIHNRKYITRWRIEPRPEDMQRYLAGEKVVPARPIIFHIDPALPGYIAGYARQGILDWNLAFEKIGFRDAIQIADYPDGGFDGADVMVNMLRYVPNSTANAMGATTVDPRSGEIIQGDIYWHHNVTDLLVALRPDGGSRSCGTRRPAPRPAARRDDTLCRSA